MRGIHQHIDFNGFSKSWYRIPEEMLKKPYATLTSLNSTKLLESAKIPILHHFRHKLSKNAKKCIEVFLELKLNRLPPVPVNGKKKT